MRVRATYRLALLAATATAALLALTAAPAQAATFHAFSSSFASSGSGSGQVALVSASTTFGNLLSGSGVAVNSTSHDVYVADTGNHRVDQFSAAGSFIRAWGWGVSDGSSAAQVCTSSCQAGISGSGPGQFSSPLSVAIDQSTGDVYVADTDSLAGSGTDLVQKFDSSGNLITAWASGGQLSGSAATDGPFSGVLAGITVDPSGNLFVNDLDLNVFEFASDGTPVATVAVPRAEYASGLASDSVGDLYRAANGNGQITRLEPAGNVLGGIDAFVGPATGFAVDLSNGDLYTAHGSDPIRHYAVDPSGDVIEPDGSICPVVPGETTGHCSPTDSFGDGSLSGAAGLGIDPSSGTLFAADPGGADVAVFTSFILADTVTDPASQVGQTTATLNGHLDPAGGGDVSDCHFQYTDDASFQANGFIGAPTAPCAEGNSFSAAAAVHADLSGLTAATTYHFRLLTTDPQGTNHGVDRPFTTAPAVALTLAPANPIGATTATLNGHVDSGSGGDVTDCHFEYADDQSFQAQGFTGAQTQACAPATPISAPTDVSADVSGLTPDTLYHVRLVATDGLGTSRSDDLPFTTLPVPVIDAAFASNLTPTEADLNATINPRGSQLTDCHFDWGTDTSYGQSAPCSPDAASIPPDSTDHLVSTHLSGLTQNTTYHWRIIAADTNGTAGATVDHTFIYDTTGQGLPDNRAYEQVTPTQKNASLIGDTTFFGLFPQVSADGSRLMATTLQCFADAGSCAVDFRGLGTPYAFDRTQDGWRASALAPPADQFAASSARTYNADADTALFSNPTAPAGEDDYYARAPDGTFTDIGPRTFPAAGASGPYGAEAFAATPDLSHVVWGASASDSKFPFDQPNTDNLYEYAGTGNALPFLVGVSTPGPGGTDLISACGTRLGPAGNSRFQGALSTDGRSVYFTALACSSGTGANAATPVPADTLFARIDGELPGAHTVPISQRSPSDCTGPCQSSPPGAANFEAASADGSKVYFTSTQQLTDNASEDGNSADSASTLGSSTTCARTTGPNGCNLYLYDFSRPPGDQLTAVSVGDTSGGGPRVQGVMAVPAGGSHVYFVAKGVLTTDPNALGQSAADGANNLYAYDAGTGGTSFVAVLPASDGPLWLPGGTDPTNVTPDGRFLVFTSHGQLTPDDTSQSGANQLFRYDASTGELIRISIGNDGFNDNGNRSTPAPFEDVGIVQTSATGWVRSDPTMSDDGAFVFFMSPVALTPHALDDVQVGTLDSQPQYAQNVYEWHAGHVYLISDGRDASANRGQTSLCNGTSSVCLLGADASGQNVFFSTADRLVPQDTDTELDYYDARVGGGFPFTPPPEPCSGDNCKAPPSAAPGAIDPGGSDTNSGPGNPTPSRQQATTRRRCKKGKRGRKCHRARHANANRGASK